MSPSQMVVEQIKAALREGEVVRTESREVPHVRTALGRSSGGRGSDTYVLKSDEDLARAITVLRSALSKYAPKGSPYHSQAQAVVDKSGISNDHSRKQLLGMLKALLFEYESGSLSSIEEIVHADVFSDFLEMSRHLLEKGFKDPAAVLAGGVLEQHLRKLAQKHGVDLRGEDDKPRKAQAINDDLAKAGAYGGDVQKEVTARLALRNQAAHGEWEKYQHAQVSIFIDGIALLVQRFPA
ncbi:MAG: hypothetical protein JST92_04020 [Deltaproteobacteria bacterium]|nr:hypothetical protein [Deltaproteobacteria bacterium]